MTGKLREKPDAYPPLKRFVHPSNARPITQNAVAVYQCLEDRVTHSAIALFIFTAQFAAKTPDSLDYGPVYVPLDRQALKDEPGQAHAGDDTIMVADLGEHGVGMQTGGERIDSKNRYFIYATPQRLKPKPDVE